ncbi:UNVERIFIED_CONTAM: hypothetical protein Slati_1560500 [Sesamum latifolium]|uniref:Uncharacterized protein n=1 Tax=Sesamum latifolium TaxID=2727402 RepID=A0AAW2XCY8_9LAMI
MRNFHVAVLVYAGTADPFAFLNQNPLPFPPRIATAQAAVHIFRLSFSIHCLPNFFIFTVEETEAIKMIKRRFYRFEHGNRDDPSESSSSSDSEVEAEATDETEVEEEEDEENVAADVREKGEASSSSGYESEDSSANEVNLDSSGLPTSDDDVAAQAVGQDIIGSFTSAEGNNVFPKAEVTPEKDERHARSEKLRREGRLKLMLNDDGQIEGETAPEVHPTTTVSGQKSDKPKKKGKGRWKQRKRSRQEIRPGKARQSTEKPGKRRKDDS